MSKIILTVLTFLLIANFSNAQIQKEDIAIANALFTKTKKSLVSDYLGIKPNLGPFWNLYDKYEEKRNAIVEERYTLLNQYAKEYMILDNASAARLANRFMENTSKAEALNRRYFKKFKKLIGGLQAATLFQIELYIQTAMQANTLTQIPIIGEMKKIEALHKISEL
jgi:transposase